MIYDLNDVGVILKRCCWWIAFEHVCLTSFICDNMELYMFQSTICDWFDDLQHGQIGEPYGRCAWLDGLMWSG